MENLQSAYCIKFVNEKVRLDIEKMPVSIRARLRCLFARMEIYGSNLGLPHTKQVETGLFEVRAMARDGIGRVFYCTQRERNIILLHAFVKKTQKTPLKELLIARQRLLEIEK